MNKALPLKQQYFVITGGPGVGKTTLLKGLGQRGFAVVQEDARRIINEQLAAEGTGLPWKDKNLYAGLMLEEGLRSYRQAPAGGMVFFDRGILDTIGYMRMEGLPVNEETERLVRLHPYQSPVFILPPWKEIYQTDAARRQTWQEAAQTFEALSQTYKAYGYDLVEVPIDTITNRINLILDVIGEQR